MSLANPATYSLPSLTRSLPADPPLARMLDKTPPPAGSRQHQFSRRQIADDPLIISSEESAYTPSWCTNQLQVSPCQPMSDELSTRAEGGLGRVQQLVNPRGEGGGGKEHGGIVE